MSHAFVAVNWNRRKLAYDACVWAGAAAFVGAFVAAGFALPGAGSSAAATAAIETAPSAMTIWMRALASCGFWMLTLILCIGPLARLDRRFLPLLYNRRHFGVSLFVIALAHGALAVYWHHGFGVLNPIVSVFASGGAWPYQAFGALALALLFALAATSHDYWNAALGAHWKALHMLVYLAYALAVAHLALQGGGGVTAAALSVLVVSGLHLAAAFSRGDGNAAEALDDSAAWVDAGRWRDIPNNRARIVTVGGGERIALFRYAGKLAAVSNVCRHQAGPLGEGRIVDGLITCPWHGYQYRPEDGCSPPPFAEKIATYRLKIEHGRVLLDPNPLPPGTPRAVVDIPESTAAAAAESPDGG